MGALSALVDLFGLVELDAVSVAFAAFALVEAFASVALPGPLSWPSVFAVVDDGFLSPLKSVTYQPVPFN